MKWLLFIAIFLAGNAQAEYVSDNGWNCADFGTHTGNMYTVFKSGGTRAQLQREMGKYTLTPQEEFLMKQMMDAAEALATLTHDGTRQKSEDLGSQLCKRITG